MFTSQQMRLLDYLSDRIGETGVSPSFDEMRSAMGLRSKSGIHRLLSGLEERGAIRRLFGRHRSIEIVRRPVLQATSPVRPEPVSGRVVPIMGRIAAGTPISAIPTVSGTVALPAAVVGAAGELFALEVKGDSMTGAGIVDGDTVVIRKQQHAAPGDIVVALVDGEEATLKRFRPKGEDVALEAANPLYPTRTLRADRVSIQGRLVSLMRRY